MKIPGYGYREIGKMNKDAAMAAMAAEDAGGILRGERQESDRRGDALENQREEAGDRET